MKLTFLLIVLAIAIFSFAFYKTKFATKPVFVQAGDSTKATSIHQFKVSGIDGSIIDFAAFKGKKILVVNTASQCGYTPQYAALQQVYEKYKDKLVVVGFPCNQFGGQEPENEKTIQTFCTKNFGVSFPLAAKVDVKGNNAAAIYKWLCNKSLNGVLNATIQWNFNKFLLNENGNIIAYFGSSTKPDSEEIVGLIENK